MTSRRARSNRISHEDENTGFGVKTIVRRKGIQPVKMVVSDLDGTLLRSDQGISTRTMAVLRQLEKQGIPFVIATARAKRHVDDMIALHLGNLYAVFYNGAEMDFDALKRQPAYFREYNHMDDNHLSLTHAMQGGNILEERFIQRDDGKLTYWVNARKSPVPLFFLHGAGVTHEMFNEQFSFFDPLYRIIAWDARLHGKSREGFKTFTIKSLLDDFLAVLDAEKIKSCHLIGQSMGGNLAQEIALRYPERVGKLVLIDCTRNLQKMTLFEKLMIAVSKPMLNMYPFEKLVEASAQACSLRPEIQRYVKECFLSMGRENFLKVFYETYNFVREDRHYKYPDKLLLLCGEKDRTGNIRKSMKRWGAESGIQYHSIPNAAHNSNQDQKKLVNGLIKAYLAI